MTAFYMFRLMYLTFHGEERKAADSAHPVHEAPSVMTIPLVILAAGSVVVGWLGMPAWTGLPNLFEHFLEPALATAYHGAHGGHAALSLEIGLAIFSVAVAAIGAYVATHFFLRQPTKAARLRERYRAVHQLVFNKYYVDEAYDLLFVNRAKGLGNKLSWFDAKIVDGAVNGSALATRITAWISGQADLHIVDRMVNLVAEIVSFFSSVFRKLQTGLAQGYVFSFVLGIVLIISIFLYWGV
jgi:NADH-quinone oxidoreductase subunit L